MEKQLKLGRLIAIRRKQLNMTQEQMAEKLHVSKSAVAKWETDGGIPDRDNLEKLSKVINVSLEDLHRIIKSESYHETDLKVNITAEVISVLESYGYKVQRPGEERGLI